MYKIYLKESDMINETHFPVIALINEAYNFDIIQFIQNLSNKIGSCYEYTHCAFWDELDEYEQSKIAHYEGVKVTTEDNEEIIISLIDMIHYLEILLMRMKADGFKGADKINILINSLREKY